MKKKKAPTTLFIVVFAGLAILVILQNVFREKQILLLVANNPGVSVLETVGNSLVCVFQDGRIAVWDWNNLPAQKGDFNAASDSAVILDSGHLASVSKAGKKMLTVHTLPAGQKHKELSIGWEDQEVWLRISSDKKTIAIIRKNPADRAGKIVFEFLTLDSEKELLGIPVSFGTQQGTEDFVDYGVDGGRILYAVGSKEKNGRIAAVDLEKGAVLWDQKYTQTEEFCSVIVSPKDQYLLAGNRDGKLYKLSAKTGAIEKQIQLLEEGESRPITNDYSVLNLAFSPDGQYYIATINPKAYLLNANSDKIFYTCAPASKLISKIALSPDNRFFAASDIRAGYPIRIQKIPESE